ncbi:hypothetical protein [Flexithrix dorotheae]|uniref:hypothetical protein n=1 Tax=Flexithrix dorotheae TaxID=70993 RepID=UPI00036DCF8D|nr:hypothetical protein [Flexithrix dorotheae]
MKKSVLFPVLLSLIILAMNLYAQDSKKTQPFRGDTALALNKVTVAPQNADPKSEVENEENQFVEITLEDIEPTEEMREVVVYDSEGEIIYSEKYLEEMDSTKLPEGAQFLMEDSSVKYFVVD